MAKSNVIRIGGAGNSKDKTVSYREKMAERFKIDLTDITPEDAEYILVNNASLLPIYNQKDGKNLYEAVIRKMNNDHELSETEKASDNKFLKSAGQILNYAIEVSKIVNRKHADDLRALIAVMRECSKYKLV